MPQGIEAETRLSELLRAVAAGQEVEISRDGHPVAKLVACATRTERQMGMDAGDVVIAEHFDAALPPGIEDSFYS